MTKNENNYISYNFDELNNHINCKLYLGYNNRILYMGILLETNVFYDHYKKRRLRFSDERIYIDSNSDSKYYIEK